METHNITPTMDLVLETLTARRRLGEKLWTFDSQHKKSIEKLQALGLVTMTHGIVENTVRASLTDAGVEAYMDDKYVPPINQEAKPDYDVLIENIAAGHCDSYLEAILAAAHGRKRALRDVIRPYGRREC